MFGRELQTGLTVLQPRKFETQTNVKGGTRSFEPDDPVWLRTIQEILNGLLEQLS